VAGKFDGNPNILFVDVTPGAETNPYRARMGESDPEFQETFLKTAASDGRNYSDRLWLETVKQYVDAAREAFRKTPCLVTLNVGSLEGPSQFHAIGAYCVEKGCYVGQNGLHASSYLEESERKRDFLDWGRRTRLYFEMNAAAGDRTGSLMDVMKATERIGCDYLGVYAVDVLKGTRAQASFDPAWEEDLRYGAQVVGKKDGAPPAAVAKQTAPPSPGPRLDSVAAPQGFHLDGENWTYRDTSLSLQGILLKPDGAGPFPAVVINHGMGGSARTFSLQKARAFVKWRFVCIATDYTHAGPIKRPARQPGSPPAAPAPRPREGLGASPENLRRARKCIEILKSLPYVDSKRIYAYGNSMGAFLTIALAAEMPDTITAAAITAGGVRTMPEGSFASPHASAAERVRCPFLIIHGSADRTVRPETSLTFKQILDENGVENKRVIFEGVGHNAHADRAAEVYPLIRAWFEQHPMIEEKP
jgi:dienelactone hydrolase